MIGGRQRVSVLYSRVSEAVVNAVFPPRCAGCGHRGVWVCTQCLPTAQLIDSVVCERCGVPMDSHCACDGLDPSLDMVRSASVYDGWIRQAIISFKYEGEQARASHLGNLAVRFVPDFGNVVLTPVPLYAKRERERGYNQSALLAAVIGQSSGEPVEQVLLRSNPTRQQVGLAAIERANNVRGAFRPISGAAISGRRFVLIDDVITTGSTLGECAATLKAAGAVWVGALTIARER